MAEYRVAVTRSANREPEDLEPRVAARTLASVETLAAQPRPRQARKLAGSESSYRLRVGRYRVLYHVDDQSRTITVFAIGHRLDVYR